MRSQTTATTSQTTATGKHASKDHTRTSERSANSAYLRPQYLTSSTRATVENLVTGQLSCPHAQLLLNIPIITTRMMATVMCLHAHHLRMIMATILIIITSTTTVTITCRHVHHPHTVQESNMQTLIHTHIYPVEHQYQHHHRNKAPRHSTKLTHVRTPSLPCCLGLHTGTVRMIHTQTCALCVMPHTRTQSWSHCDPRLLLEQLEATILVYARTARARNKTLLLML